MTQRPVLHSATFPHMQAITLEAPGGPEMLRWGDGARPGRRAGRGARRRRGRRGQPRRPHATPGPLPAAAGRVGDHRAGVSRGTSPRSARASPAGGSATRCARCSRAAATPSRWSCPRRSCCPCPTGVDLVTAAGIPEVACTVWSNVVMTAAADGGRDVPRARRHGRHRHARDPGGEGARARGSRPRRAPPDRLDVCRELGADIAIDYHDDFVAALRRSPTAGPTSILDNHGRQRASPPTSTRWPPTAVWSSSACRAARRPS